MRQKIQRYIDFRWPVIFILLHFLSACANIGNPNGGPYDEDPPKMVGCKPAMNQLNYKGKKVEVLFDEYVSLENPGENIIITPPQQQTPQIMALGKKVVVELKDSLKENTTYTIDFTSSIVDNNEKNVLENFSFAFATGDVLDTLQIAGILINAVDLEPVQNVLVGIHNNLSDTAFTTTPFLRTSKTNEQGQFVIRNISPGSYHLFALEDKNRNYIYDKNNNEALAFLDSVIIPECERKVLPDTLWRDSVTIDSIIMTEKTLYSPKDILLWNFVDSAALRQRMLRPVREKENIFTLNFNAPLDTAPEPIPLNFEPEDSLWYVVQQEKKQEAFSLNYWILDSMIYKTDTLEIAVSYWRNNDTVPDLLELQTDTLNLINRATLKKRKVQRKKPAKIRSAGEELPDSLKPEEQKEPVVPLEVSVTPSGVLNPYDMISVMFNEPVMNVQKDFFVLEAGVDTLWNVVDFEFEKDSLHPMKYYIKRLFAYGETYRLTIDSAILCGVYGHCNGPLAVMLSVKEEESYGHLVISVSGLPASTDTIMRNEAFMELLNSGGQPIRKVRVKEGVASFIDMVPNQYYARIILDKNGNGKWDAGNYEEKRQPEKVIYFMKQFEIRQNWKIEETWDIRTSKTGVKPKELMKNKPKEDTKRKRNYKDESKPQKNNSGTNLDALGGLRL